MSYKYYLILFFISIYSTTGFAQYNVIGIIQDKSSELPLSYTGIDCNGDKTVSNHKGEFSIASNKRKIHIEFSYIGYQKLVIDTTIKNSNLDLGVIYLKEDTKTLDEVTITSGKYRKAISEITVSLEMIKPKFIEKSNINKFDDLLEKIPGVNYIDGQANIRGGSGFSYGAGSRVLVLIDNMPALQFDSGYPNWENIPVETIAKVEVMKGAGSALYGSAAMNGVINILSVYAKKKTKLKIKSFYSVYDSPSDSEKKWWDSSPNKYGFSGLFAKKIGKIDVVSSFYLQKFNSYKENCFNNYGRGTLNLKYHLTDALKIGINTNINSGQKLNFFYWKDSKSGAYSADTAAYAGQDKQVYIIDPYISFYSKNGIKHKLQTRIYYASNRVSGSKSNKSINYYGEYQFQKKIPKYQLTFTSGITGSISNTNAELYGDTSYVAKNMSVYLQVEKKLFDRLSLVGGGRYENNTIKGPGFISGIDIRDKYKSEGKPVFRFGANFKLFRNTNFRINWGQGFRFPTIAEKFTNTFSGDLVIRPNPDLKSETGETIEMGIRQGWKISKIKGFADLSLFQSKYEDMIEFHLKSQGLNFFFSADNIGNTIIKGIEFSSGFTGSVGDVKVNFMGGILHINPKYQDFTDEIKGGSSVDYNILKYRYKNSIKFDTEVEYKNITIGIGSSYNSFMDAVDKVFEIDGLILKGVKEYRQNHNHGTNIYRMRLGYRYKNVGVQFNIDNLFNLEYSVRPGLLEAPRKFTLSLSYNIG